MLTVPTEDVLRCMHHIASFTEQKSKEGDLDYYVRVSGGDALKLHIHNRVARMISKLGLETAMDLPAMWVPSHKFYEILKTLSSPEIDLSPDMQGGSPRAMVMQARVTERNRARNFQFPTTVVGSSRNKEPKPTLPTGGGFSLPIRQFTSALNKASKCLAKRTEQWTATSDVILEFVFDDRGEPHYVNVIGINKATVVYTKVDIDGNIGIADREMPRYFVFDSKMAKALEKACANPPLEPRESDSVCVPVEHVRISKASRPNAMSFTMGNQLSFVLEVSGKKDVAIPPLDRVLSQDPPNSLQLNRKELMNAMRQMVIQVDGAKREKGYWKISREDPETGAGKVCIEVEGNGRVLGSVEIDCVFDSSEELEIAFLPVSVNLGLEVIRADDIVMKVGPGRVAAKLVEGSTTFYLQPAVKERI